MQTLILRTTYPASKKKKLATYTVKIANLRTYIRMFTSAVSTTFSTFFLL